MLQGLYAAAAGMNAQQRRIEAVSNDVANVNTHGYRGTRVAFRDLAYVDEPTGNGVRAGAGAAVTDAGRMTGQGAIQRTDNPLDVAIEGPGFLQVRTADGRAALTRAGSLRVDADRRLVTAGGQLVQPPVQLPQDVQPSAVQIGADGTIRSGTRELGRLRLVDVPAPQGLLATGDNLYVATAASGPVRDATGARVQQGALEGSNVDMADAMVDLMDAQRSYGLASKALQMQDQLMEIANGVKR
jgi:flagellar basal-body rod protein FlgG